MSEDTRTYKRKPFYNIYKPLKKDGAGAALQFSYDDNKHAIFLEAAQQKGPKLEIGAKDQFDWNEKIVFKIGIADIAKILVLFAGSKEAKCIHKPQEGNRVSALEIIRGEYNGAPNFSIKLSRTEDGQTQRVGMFLSQDEMAVLAHFIRESLTRMLGFGEY